MDKPKPPPPPHATAAAAGSSRSLENIKSLLLKCAVASTPARKPLTSHQKAFIEERIGQIFPTIHTPDHPPYAWMIENAIQQLNEDCGSSEESISKFIVKEYKDLPFAHASLLRHHLKKLSESDDLISSRNGCYSISKSRNLHNPTSKPCPKLTNTTTSLIPVFSSCPSPSCSSSSGSEYESSTTYSSSELSDPIRKGRKKTRRKKIKRKKSQNARGIKIRTKHDSVQGRGRGRDRGRGRRLGSNKNKMMEVNVDHQYITIDDDVAFENIQGNQNQDSVDVESRVDEERIEPLWQEKLVGGVDNGSTPSMSRRKKMNISGQGSKNVGPRQRNVRSMHTPQRGEKRDRPSLRDMQMEEQGNIMEMDDVDMLDELIDEVYMELKGETERERLETQDDHAEVMRCELNRQCTDDEIHETFGWEPLEREPRVDGNLEEDLSSGTHVVNENQFQLHPGQTELAQVLDESQRQESNEIEHQVQRQGVAMEIIEQIDTREGENNSVENPIEVVEEQIEHIEISDGLDCDLVDREITAEEEFGHYDELENFENVNKNSEEQYNCQKSRADEHSSEPQVEDRDQQSEELAMELSEQAVNNDPKDESNEIIDVAPLEQDHHKSTDDDPNELQLQECTFATPDETEEVVMIKQKLIEDELDDEAASDGQLQLTEMIEEQNEHIGQPEPILEQNQPEKCCEEQRKIQIENDEDQHQQNSKETLKMKVNPMVEPQRRQLRPRPLKFQQEQTQQQFGLFTPEKFAETNSCRKLRPRLPKNESSEAANRSARHAR